MEQQRSYQQVISTKYYILIPVSTMNFISILKAKLDIKNGERRDFRKFVLVILIEDCVQKMIKRRVRGFSCEPSHSPLFR